MYSSFFSCLQRVIVLERNLIWNKFQEWIFQTSTEFVASILIRARKDLVNTVFCLSVRVFFKLSKVVLFRSEELLYSSFRFGIHLEKGWRERYSVYTHIRLEIRIEWRVCFKVLDQYVAFNSSRVGSSQWDMVAYRGERDNSMKRKILI